MPLKCRTAPSDSVTVPVSPVPTCPDVTVMFGTPRIWTKFVGVRVLPTLRPTIEFVEPACRDAGKRQFAARSQEREGVSVSRVGVESQSR